MNISDEIKRLHELHQAGALSDAEFEQAKAKVLASQVNLNKPGAAPAFGGAPGYSGAAGAGPAAGPASGAAGSSGSDDFVSEIGRLRRARLDRWLGGVCGGLGRISGMESWIWRVVFAGFTFFFGVGVLIYLLMWIFVPEE